jgi:hypothetical protein
MTIKNEELTYLLHGLFENSEIGLIGERNNNGVDIYFCPSCYAHKNIQGYCNITTHITEIKHRDGCLLMKLYNMIKEEEE